MERATNIETAKKIMGKNFVGPEELSKISTRFKISVPENKIPLIPFSSDFLKTISRDYILILGLSKDKNGKSLTINKMRDILGFNPEKSEPCFYNQDWYLKENFAAVKKLDFKWYLVSKKINNNTKGEDPNRIKKMIKKGEDFPSAILVTFTFFVYYFLTGEVLWKNDFVWCKDNDSNGDRIYVGRYSDPKRKNKDGFNVHRLLSISNHYGLASEII